MFQVSKAEVPFPDQSHFDNSNTKRIQQPDSHQ